MSLSSSDFDDNLDERCLSGSLSSGNSPRQHYTDDEYIDEEDTEHVPSQSEASHPGRSHTAKLQSDPTRHTADIHHPKDHHCFGDDSYPESDENMQPDKCVF